MNIGVEQLLMNYCQRTDFVVTLHDQRRANAALFDLRQLCLSKIMLKCYQ